MKEIIQDLTDETVDRKVRARREFLNDLRAAPDKSFEDGMNQPVDFIDQPADLTWMRKEGRTNIENEEFADLMWQLGERQRRGDKITHGEALSFMRSRGFFYLPPDPPHFVQPKLDHRPTLLFPNNRKPRNAGRGWHERKEEIDQPGASSEDKDDEEHRVEPMPEEGIDTTDHRLQSVQKLLQEGLITEEEAVTKKKTILDEFFDRQYMTKYGRTRFTAR